MICRTVGNAAVASGLGSRGLAPLSEYEMARQTVGTAAAVAAAASTAALAAEKPAAAAAVSTVRCAVSSPPAVSMPSGPWDCPSVCAFISYQSVFGRVPTVRSMLPVGG